MSPTSLGPPRHLRSPGKWKSVAAVLAALLALAASPASPDRVDRHGDALPPGALFRFGSVRLRHASVIRNSALSPDGKLLATAAPGSVIVWDLAAGKPLRRFPCGRFGQFCTPGLAFSPGGERLA